MKNTLSNPRFEQFYDLLNEWNSFFNLTSITEKDQVYTKHFLDSVTAADLLPQNAHVLDIGCGAGFPSIPLKLVRDDLTFTLIDSVFKKITFVKTAVLALSLSGVECLHTRIEDYTYRLHDAAVVRAVATLNVLAEYTLPFLKVGGRAVFYKAGNIDNELNSALRAFDLMGGSVTEVKRFMLPGTDISRSLVVVDKNSPSPRGYPRRGNKPRVSPL